MTLEEMFAVMPENLKDVSKCPSGELHEDDAGYVLGDGTVAFDDQSNAPLKPDLVRKARVEEIKYFRQMGVYTKVPLEKCWAETGRAPIDVRWVDINKGDDNSPNYRSRLVAKEFKTDVRPDLYAATPPGESLRLLLSRMASDKGLELMYADVSRAYFYAKAVRPVFVRLPAEDFEPGDELRCGSLVMSMYGTRDAALNWSSEYSDTLIADGFVQGRSNPCLFWNPSTDVAVMVHGDDFVAVGRGPHLASKEGIGREVQAESGCPWPGTRACQRSSHPE